MEFFGSCKDIDLSIVDKNLIDLLIDRNILYNSTHEENLEILYDYGEDSITLFMPIWLNEIAYNICPDLLEEAYYLLKNYIESFSWKTTELQMLINEYKMYEEDERKIEHLKKAYDEYNFISASFALYNEKEIELILSKEYGLTSTYKEFICSEIGYCPEFLQAYLQYPFRNEFDDIEKAFKHFINIFWKAGEGDFVFILDQWLIFWKNKNAMRVIKQKIKELEFPKNTKMEKNSLKDFLPDDSWRTLVKVLERENIINEKLEILEQGIGIQPRGVLSFIGLQVFPLIKKDVKNQKKLVAVLNNTFHLPQGLRLSEGNFSDYKNNVFPFRNDYQDLFSFWLKNQA